MYLRVEGIQKLLHLVRSLNEQDEISVFLRLQNHRETNSMLIPLYITTQIMIIISSVALHILAYVLQNLPPPIMQQSTAPLPKVCLKEETPPATRPTSPGGINPLPFYMNN